VDLSFSSVQNVWRDWQSALAACHTLDLQSCSGLQEVSVLGGVHSLSLAGTRISSVAGLHGCHYLDLSFVSSLQSLSAWESVSVDEFAVHTLLLSRCSLELSEHVLHLISTTVRVLCVSAFGRPLDWVHRLEHVHALDLSFSHLSEPATRQLASLRSVRWLNLDRCAGVRTLPLRCMPELRWVSARGTQLSGEALLRGWEEEVEDRETHLHLHQHPHRKQHGQHDTPQRREQDTPERGEQAGQHRRAPDPHRQPRRERDRAARTRVRTPLPAQQRLSVLDLSYCPVRSLSALSAALPSSLTELCVNGCPLLSASEGERAHAHEDWQSGGGGEDAVCAARARLLVQFRRTHPHCEVGSVRRHCTKKVPLPPHLMPWCDCPGVPPLPVRSVLCSARGVVDD
jgi:hypothetical protein